MATKMKLACSFCGQGEDKVAKLVAGPGVYICDGCVQLASQVIAEAKRQDEADS
jgi:ATP-dependent protease Clp ATPase subunit